MGQLLLRDVDERVIESLQRRAARAGRSIEAEHRAILEGALASEVETFAEAAARFRARTGPLTTDSAAMIRELRDAPPRA